MTVGRRTAGTPLSTSQKLPRRWPADESGRDVMPAHTSCVDEGDMTTLPPNELKARAMLPGVAVGSVAGSW